MKTERFQKLNDELLVINLLTFTLIGIVALMASDVLRIILGLPFILFFPGYTLIADNLSKVSVLCFNDVSEC